MGYHRAGFDVVGVDINPQPHYPFEFHQADVLEVLPDIAAGWVRPGMQAWDFDLIHASPPCQLFTVYNNVKSIAKSTSENYENLIPQVRAMLRDSGVPYVIENVPGARSELADPVQFCGTTFGIPVRRHRLFEANWDLHGLACKHGDFTERRFPGSSNRPNGRTVCNVGEYRVKLETQKECMQVGWKVTLRELSEMIPPVYTESVGNQFREVFSR